MGLFLTQLTSWKCLESLLLKDMCAKTHLLEERARRHKRPSSALSNADPGADTSSQNINNSKPQVSKGRQTGIRFPTSAKGFTPSKNSKRCTYCTRYGRTKSECMTRQRALELQMSIGSLSISYNIQIEAHGQISRTKLDDWLIQLEMTGQTSLTTPNKTWLYYFELSGYLLQTASRVKCLRQSQSLRQKVSRRH